MMQDPVPSPQTQASRSGVSPGAILRRRWWIIAIAVVSAVAAATVISLTVAPTYETSLRLQTLALDDVDVMLFTRRSVDSADAQIELTKDAFGNIVRSPLIAWRTIDDLEIDLNADALVDKIDVSAAGDFVTVSYVGSSAKLAQDILTRQVENALANLNSIQARPALASGQFIEAQLAEQGKVLAAAQDALQKFQLEHAVGDVDRELNAMQDVVRSLRSDLDASEIEAKRAETMAEQYRAYAADGEKALLAAEKQLDEAQAAVEGEATPDQQTEIDTLTERVAALQTEMRAYQNAERSQAATAAAVRSAIAESEAVASRRTADLAQLIGLSDEYNTLVITRNTAQSDYDLLRAKVAEARLKYEQIAQVGPMQVVEPAYLPGAPSASSTLRLALVAAVAALLLSLVFVLVLELIRPTHPIP